MENKTNYPSVVIKFGCLVWSRIVYNLSGTLYNRWLTLLHLGWNLAFFAAKFLYLVNYFGEVYRLSLCRARNNENYLVIFWGNFTCLFLWIFVIEEAIGRQPWQYLDFWWTEGYLRIATKYSTFFRALFTNGLHR